MKTRSYLVALAGVLVVLAGAAVALDRQQFRVARSNAHRDAREQLSRAAQLVTGSLTEAQAAIDGAAPAVAPLFTTPGAVCALDYTAMPGFPEGRFDLVAPDGRVVCTSGGEAQGVRLSTPVPGGLGDFALSLDTSALVGYLTDHFGDHGEFRFTLGGSGVEVPQVGTLAVAQDLAHSPAMDQARQARRTALTLVGIGSFALVCAALWIRRSRRSIEALEQFILGLDSPMICGWCGQDAPCACGTAVAA